MSNYRIVIHPNTFQAVENYAEILRNTGLSCAGVRLQSQLVNKSGILDAETLLTGLLQTKKPTIFAESQVRGDGSDWNCHELSILGDIGVATDAKIYDNGAHRDPEVHEDELKATLLFTPGALLVNHAGHAPADWREVVQDGQLNQNAFNNLCERRILPLLLYANLKASISDRMAFVTIPGIGCGQFAGPFRGRMGFYLKKSLEHILGQYAGKLPAIHAVYYDPYDECENERYQFFQTSFMVRPLIKSNKRKPQLCAPTEYEEVGDEFKDCMLFSFVAWDHVSWPGNDYWQGDRVTDDGVKAAASSSMHSMTGFSGFYDRRQNRYLPPIGYLNWSDVVVRNKLAMNASGRVDVLGIDNT